MSPTRTLAAIALPALGFALTLASSAQAVSTPKKGVGTWAYGGEPAAMTAVGATWWYTWATGPGSNTVPSGVSFVPMIWGSANVTTSALNQVKTEGSVLLGFNEPDGTGQSNMTPAAALALWPQLVATGMRLGSPAVAANAQKAGGWLETFMNGASTMGLRVDFICLHWYGGDFNPTSAVTELKSYIDQTHAKYNLPIWVTEFALTNFSGGVSYPTETEQAQFAAGAVDMLEAEPYVERYAWFALPPCDNNAPCGLDAGAVVSGNTRPLSFDGGALTPVGIAYAGAGPDGGTLMADGGGAGDAAYDATYDDVTVGGSSGGAAASSGASSGSAGTSSGVGSGSGAGSSGGGASSGVAGAGGGDGGAGSSASSGGCNCEQAGTSHGPRGVPYLLALLALLVPRRRAFDRLRGERPPGRQRRQG